MKATEANAGAAEHTQEAARLAALKSYEILDTAPERCYDAITQLAVEYIGAQTAVLAFADETRVWVKAHVGASARELPRENSIFEMVLACDGPVVVDDICCHPECRGQKPHLRQLGVVSFAAVPLRSCNGHVLGMLASFSSEARHGLTPDELQMLESLASLVTSELELKKLRKERARSGTRRIRGGARTAAAWPSALDMRRALDNGEFVLHYQPEVDLETLRVIGVEALIRWMHPERGLVPPGDFIPQAEESGMILPIGDWGLAEACHQIQLWNRDDPRNGSLRVCVNLSARQFSRPGLADHVESLLMQSGTDSRQLGLEMTESSLITNLSTAVEVLEGLRALGVSLLMDDFGTGYSSLNHLHSFPFDVLKIDRSFVGRMTNGEQPLQIVRTIIELARVLKMDVVAEGIETREQFRLLRQMGCRYGQGFLFARPMPAADLAVLLRIPGRLLCGFEEEDCAVRMSA